MCILSMSVYLMGQNSECSALLLLALEVWVSLNLDTSCPD